MTASSPFSAFLIVMAGAGINSARHLQKGEEAFSTILAGAVFGTVCVAINNTTKSDLGTGLGILFLLSSFLTNGVAFMDTLTSVLDSY